MLLLPASVVAVLFPTVSAIGPHGDRAALLRLLGTSVRAVVFVLLPAACVVIAFAAPGLDAWLGPDYARHSATALQILAVGVLFNAAAHVPFVYVQALGRPDVTARIHLAELVVHVPLTWALVSHLGIAGAALAWTIRVTVDAVVVLAAAVRLLGLPLRRVVAARTVYLGLAAGCLLAALSAASIGFRHAPVASVAASIAAIAVFAAAAWRHIAGDDERSSLRAAFGRGRGPGLNPTSR
jgi:O-antigen/teichoic acid export membrane protein